MIAIWLNRQQGRRELSELDDRLLADVGISREDAVWEARKPFWRTEDTRFGKPASRSGAPNCRHPEVLAVFGEPRRMEASASGDPSRRRASARLLPR
jgi:hypothetical protein